MLYLNPASPNIFVAQQMHYRHMKCFVQKKIGPDRCADTTCKICRSNRSLADPLDPRIPRFLNTGDNLDKILSGLPAQLEQVNIDFWAMLFPRRPLNSILQYFPNLHPRTLAARPGL